MTAGSTITQQTGDPNAGFSFATADQSIGRPTLIPPGDVKPPALDSVYKDPTYRFRRKQAPGVTIPPPTKHKMRKEKFTT